jgi:hypothetical protein
VTTRSICLGRAVSGRASRVEFRIVTRSATPFKCAMCWHRPPSFARAPRGKRAESRTSERRFREGQFPPQHQPQLRPEAFARSPSSRPIRVAYLRTGLYALEPSVFLQKRRSATKPRKLGRNTRELRSCRSAMPLGEPHNSGKRAEARPAKPYFHRTRSWAICTAQLRFASVARNRIASLMAKLRPTHWHLPAPKESAGGPERSGLNTSGSENNRGSRFAQPTCRKTRSPARKTCPLTWVSADTRRPRSCTGLS